MVDRDDQEREMDTVSRPYSSQDLVHSDCILAVVWEYDVPPPPAHENDVSGEDEGG